MTDNEKLYQERLADYKNTCNHIEPKHVPVIGYYLTYAVGYAGAKTDDVLDNPDTIADVFRKVYDDVYADLNWGGITTPIRALERLGSHSFFISDDGHTIQHKENSVMRADEYEEWFKEGDHFLFDTLAKRKFPALAGSKEEAKSALIDVMNYVNKFGAGNGRWSKVLREEYGVAQLVDCGKVYPPMDVLFDRVRGFRGCLTDLRRQRENVIEAVNLLDKYYRPLTFGAGTGDSYTVDTLHCPTYLSTKDFEEIFWPTFKDYLMEVYNRGSKTFLVMEGDWHRFFDIMTSQLPKDSVVCCLDDDDPIVAKKTIGQYFAFAGGLKVADLKFLTKEQCLDKVKHIIDECAPGGGYIYGMDKALCSVTDVKAENLIAVQQFVHDYGTY